VASSITHWAFPTLTQLAKTAVTQQSVFAIRQVSSSSDPQQSVSQYDMLCETLTFRVSPKQVIAVAGSSPYIDLFVARGFKAGSILPAPVM
jgi:hypothetical protein